MIASVQRKRAYLACFTIHFLLILMVCCRDTLTLLAHGYTVAPPALEPYWSRAAEIVSSALGENLAANNPLHDTLRTYMRLAGIDFGYGFFAPNVSDNYKIVFELHYPDGRVDYALPRVSTRGEGLRMSALIDNIARTRVDSVRELMIKMMAYSVWSEHPDATYVRAVLGFVELPTSREFSRGASESYQFLYAYDFEFPKAEAAP